MTELTRRRFMALGTTAAAASLAGCTSSENDPTYTAWVPASDEGLLTAYVDFTVSRKTADVDPLLPLYLPDSDTSKPSELVPDLSALDRIDEPLLRLPLQTGGRVIGVGSLSIVASGLGYLIDPDRPTEGVTELLVANGTVVGTGAVDVDRADEALRAGREGPFGDVRFGVTDEGDEYTWYEPEEDVDARVAISESAVVVGETRRAVETVIDTRNGDHDRATGANDTFGWLDDTAGSGDIVVGWVGPIELQEFYWGDRQPDPATALVTGEQDVLSSVSFSPGDDETTVSLAVQGDTVTESSNARLATQLGVPAGAGELSVDGNQLSATTTYSSAEIDLEFTDPPGTTSQPTQTAGGDVPAEVARAVPDDAFEFTYKRANGVVRVDFVKPVEADEVTVRSVETESEVSTTTPGDVSYLSVYVASGGDEVVVTATVDGVTGEVARTEVP